MGVGVGVGLGFRVPGGGGGRGWGGGGAGDRGSSTEGARLELCTVIPKIMTTSLRNTWAVLQIRLPFSGLE